MICWKIRIFAYWTTPRRECVAHQAVLWFAEKFVSLLIEQHHASGRATTGRSCDLLKNSYLCLLNNTADAQVERERYVVICWKIRIFAYWTTPKHIDMNTLKLLWFAEKFVSLLIEQHPQEGARWRDTSCDLLKNSYLCLLNNTPLAEMANRVRVVICWKIRIFAYWTTPGVRVVRRDVRLWFAEKFVSLLIEQHRCSTATACRSCCDLLKNSYLCLLNNTMMFVKYCLYCVVICWKIRIFAYWTTPLTSKAILSMPLWFAEKFVSLLIEQHLELSPHYCDVSCDLLKNSYLCLLNNTTPAWGDKVFLLWFAEKFVSLLIEQHPDWTVAENQPSCDLLKNSYLCLLNNTRYK